MNPTSYSTSAIIKPANVENAVIKSQVLQILYNLVCLRIKSTNIWFFAVSSNDKFEYFW